MTRVLKYRPGRYYFLLVLIIIEIYILNMFNFLCILFIKNSGLTSANFENRITVNFWITYEILYEIDMHLKCLQFNF